jgi:hypothetical protein
MKVSEALLLVWGCALAGSAGALAESTGGSQAVIIDTDIFGDVDDVGALTVANTLQNCGLADVKGIAINTHSKYGALAANVRFIICKHSRRNPDSFLIERLSVLILGTGIFQLLPYGRSLMRLTLIMGVSCMVSEFCDGHVLTLQ